MARAPLKATANMPLRNYIFSVPFALLSGMLLKNHMDSLSEQDAVRAKLAALAQAQARAELGLPPVADDMSAATAAVSDAAPVAPAAMPSKRH